MNPFENAGASKSSHDVGLVLRHQPEDDDFVGTGPHGEFHGIDPHVATIAAQRRPDPLCQADLDPLGNVEADRAPT